MGSLEGKVAFITGAARGQGRSHAVRLAAEGADIIAVDICAQLASVPYPLAGEADLAKTAEKVTSLGRRIWTGVADVRDFGGLDKALTAGIDYLGRLDIVLANAGIAPMSAEDDVAWQDVIDVNLTGTQNTLRAATPVLISQGVGGAIVITSSTMGLSALGTDRAGALAYAASKHGLVGLMRSYANFLAPHKIRVNTIHPAGVVTPMVLNPAVQQYLQSLSSASGNALPVDMLEPIDISNAVAWLVSDAARYITGITLPVDAGYLNHR